ncbi:MAG: TIGR03118 family protein [Acidobacteria bacterium]|nr:TIGR03118 family protein [Acidobacteriota bacterium]
MKTRIALVFGAFSIASGVAFAHAFGPDPRFTGAPGDDPLACTSCHSGTLNSGKGSVKIVLPGARYTPGAKHRIAVQIADPDQRVWGFEFTARLASDLTNGQAGDLSPSDSNTQVICDDLSPKPCSAAAPVQFIEHTLDGSRPGTANGASFEFDWTAPAAGAGKVTFYVAGNAGNGNGHNTGDHIYAAMVEMDAADSGSTTGGLTVPATRFALRALVSDVPGQAEKTDPNLANPWGISLSASGPFWVSNAKTGTSTAYNGGGETGQVFNSGPAFELAAGKPATVLFATEAGVIAGWNADVDATGARIVVDNSGAGAVYKGLALGQNESGPMLYAANFNAGTVDTFDYTFKPATLSGSFKDPNLPAGFAPFNIQRIGRKLYVTYARQSADKRNDVAGAGNGFVNVFDMNGNLVKRLITDGQLNSPWGLALAPSFFGDLSGTLLVGNFGDGRINAYDALTGEFLSALADKDGKVIAVEGLWGLVFGNGKAGGDANALYFTAGISAGGAVRDHGLFGSIVVQQ